MKKSFFILAFSVMGGGLVWAAGPGAPDPPSAPGSPVPPASSPAPEQIPPVIKQEATTESSKTWHVEVETGDKTVQIGSLRWKTGRKVHVPAEETWRGDLYALTGKAVIEGLVEGDATLFSGDINVPGKVTQDLNAAAAEVRLAGEVGDDFHVAASKLLMSGTVGSDLLVWSGQTELAREGLVKGSAVIYSGQVDLQGKIEGAIKITGGKVELNGEVGGDVAVSCDELIIGPQAHIAGRLVYDARNTIEVAPGVVAGGIEKTEHQALEMNQGSEKEEGLFHFSSGFRFFWHLFLAVVALIAGVLLLLFFRPFVDGALVRGGTGQGLGACFGIGLVGFLVLLVAGVLCLCLLPLALGIWSALGALLYFGGLIGKMILGGWILVLLPKKSPSAAASPGEGGAVKSIPLSSASHPLLALVIGIGLLFLIGLIPFFGPFVWFLVTVTGIGAALLQLRGGRQGETLSVTLPA